MKLYDTLISVFLIFCLVSVVCAAPNDNTTASNSTTASNNTAASNNTTASNNFVVPKTIPHLESDGGHHTGIPRKALQSTSVVTPLGKVAGIAVATKTSAVNFASIQTTGKCLDNTKKVAVYMAAMTNEVYSETEQASIKIPVTYDPLTTAMFFEYNPEYLGDSNIASKLKASNYDLLIVPMSQMSTTAASAISDYIASGGSVWFLNDPCMTPTGTGSVQLTSILGNGASASISSSTTITVVNNEQYHKWTTCIIQASRYHR